MKITLRIDNQDAAECPDTPWAAFMVVRDDEGREEQTAGAGVGATPREAVECMVREFVDDERDPLIVGAGRALGEWASGSRSASALMGEGRAVREG